MSYLRHAPPIVLRRTGSLSGRTAIVRRRPDVSGYIRQGPVCLTCRARRHLRGDRRHHYSIGMNIENRIASADLPIETPHYHAPRQFNDAGEAVKELKRLYVIGTQFLRERFEELMAGKEPDARYRAFYPEVRLFTGSHAKIDSRLAYGHVAGPGEYLHDHHAARSLLELSDAADRPAHRQSRRAGQHRHFRSADAAAFRPAARAAMSPDRSTTG